MRLAPSYVQPQKFVELAGILNTGSGSVIFGVGDEVEKIAFDDLVDDVTKNGQKRVRLLKVDCEGAEWPILLTSQRLLLIDEICGEFHEIGGEYVEINEGREGRDPVFNYGGAPLTIEQLVKCLTDAGFTVTYEGIVGPTALSKDWVSFTLEERLGQKL